ncbi:uncharacterized protein N7515_000886 [Penicillium bovifimosum]|uniref:Uncharacterized protein n=1 Tax=Penicillium bovifimosum TaxID=126998 RepID=A0A9W9LBH4_9EURO|nr:uncharacterized protein N7515_000886 [Penicillium bovifimosum]KAJ5146322.1 hypothetical protein N7515_000886 [Penicillium bovifimosum]
MPVTRSQSGTQVSQVNHDPSSAQEDSEITRKSLEQEQATKGSFIEWFDLDYSDNSILKQTDWKLILKEVRKVDGCRQITWTNPVENGQRLWIIIRKIKIRLLPDKSNAMVKDWRRRAQRDVFRQSDAMTQTMKEIIFSPNPDSHSKALSIYRYIYASAKFILDCFSKPNRPDMVYEVWTVYFPVEVIVALLDSDPLYKFPRMVNYRSHPYASEDPIGAVLAQVTAFVAGEVEYKGRRCKRIAWFMNWKSTGEEKTYKGTEYDRKENGQGSTVMESFIEKLHGLGMVGYESCHAKFQEIKHWS